MTKTLQEQNKTRTKWLFQQMYMILKWLKLLFQNKNKMTITTKQNKSKTKQEQNSYSIKTSQEHNDYSNKCTWYAQGLQHDMHLWQPNATNSNPICSPRAQMPFKATMNVSQPRGRSVTSYKNQDVLSSSNGRSINGTKQGGPDRCIWYKRIPRSKGARTMKSYGNWPQACTHSKAHLIRRHR